MPCAFSNDEKMYVIDTPTIPQNILEYRAKLLRDIIPSATTNKKIDYISHFNELVKAIDKYNDEVIYEGFPQLVLNDSITYDFLHAYFKTYCYKKSHTLTKILTFIFYPLSVTYREIKRAWIGTSIPSEIYQIEMDYEEEKAIFIPPPSLSLDAAYQRLEKKLSEEIPLERNEKHIPISATFITIIKKLKQYQNENRMKFSFMPWMSNKTKAADLLEVASNSTLNDKEKMEKTREIISTMYEKDSLYLCVANPYAP